MKKRQILISFILIVAYLICNLSRISYAQDVPKNIPHYDRKFFLPGWFCGINTMYTDISDKKNLPYQDSIMSFNAHTKPGVQLGIMADLRLLSFLYIRFLPNVSFSERNFSFLIKQNSTFHTTNQSFEVIYLDLPFEIKLTAKRWHNFRPYLLGGFKYDYDLGSIRRKKIRNDEFLFKVNDSEVSYVIGAGFDFYFPMFKMTLEIKNSFGTTDVLNHDYKTVYADCIEKMRTQMFYINLIFQ